MELVVLPEPAWILARSNAYAEARTHIASPGSHFYPIRFEKNALILTQDKLQEFFAPTQLPAA